MEVMKDFGEMTISEFRQAQSSAYLATWSESAKFMLATSGYRFEHINGDCIDKWELYVDYCNKPRQLRMIMNGRHPSYKRIMKSDFDEIQCKQLELGLLPETE